MSSEEEEDMANCLIMLAHGVSPVKEDKLDDRNYEYKTDNLKIRSVTEITATTAGANSSDHNYECKSCNRGFPSFQALGGHRASHKKPKLTTEDTHSASIKFEFSKPNQPEPPEFIQTGYTNNKVIKVHECSICGSEFLSGQALGGHMRRHRTPPPSTNQIANHSTIKSPGLSLDLNLPAPEVIDDVLTNFQFTAASLVDCHY